MAVHTYATVADIRGRYDAGFVDRIALHVDLDTDTREVDDAKLDLALADATAEIDCYLTAVYSVQLEFVPPLVKRMAIDIGLYHAAITADRMTEILQVRYDGWIKHLAMIASRKIGLGIPSGQPSDADPTKLAGPPTEGTATSQPSSGRTRRV